MPCRSSLREVGAAEERPAVGVRNTVIGQPPLPGHRLDRLHVDRVDVGALLAVDLHVHEQSFITAATSGSSNDSCAITWHQWHDE